MCRKQFMVIVLSLSLFNSNISYACGPGSGSPLANLAFIAIMVPLAVVGSIVNVFVPHKQRGKIDEIKKQQPADAPVTGSSNLQHAS